MLNFYVHQIFGTFMHVDTNNSVRSWQILYVNQVLQYVNGNADFHFLLDYFNVSLILELNSNSGTLNCGIRNCNSKDLFQKFFRNYFSGIL